MGRGHSAEVKERIARGVRRFHERKRLAARIRPRDLRRLRESGTVAESLRPVMEIAEDEMSEIIASLGGIDAITPITRAVIEDAVSVGVVLRGELDHYLQARDSASGSRVGTLASVRRQAFALIGLEAKGGEPIDLSTYLEERAVAGRDEVPSEEVES